MNRTEILLLCWIRYQFWRFPCWVAPASWWFNRAQRPRLADLYVCLNGNCYWAYECLQGRASRLLDGKVWDQRPEGW